jgi:hypothetical protein
VIAVRKVPERFLGNSTCPGRRTEVIRGKAGLRERPLIARDPPFVHDKELYLWHFGHVILLTA